MPAAEVDEQKLYQLVGRRIRDLRAQRTPKLTQARLASLLQVERTSVTNIENGTQRPPLAFLYRLFLALDVALMDVLPNPEDVRVHRISGELQLRSSIPPKTANVISKLSNARGKPSARSRQ